MNRAAILQQLAAWGAEGQAVEDAAHALTAMRQAAHKGKPFDFALANWWLPKMDGLSLAQSVHGDPELKNTKIVLMASLAHHLWTKELESAHVSGFVSKPLLYSQLFAVLSSAESVSALAVQGAPPIAARRRKDESLIRVLLAEDNMVNQTVTVRQLERLGYACDSVGNGREVLQALRRARYDVVLMDLQMPEMDGYQTTVEIRRREKSAHTIIIAMTAHALKEDRERCLASGMDDYISKPVKTAELAAVLERWAPSNRAPAPPGVASAPPAPGGVVPRVDPEQFSATLGAEGADQASLLKLYLESTAANLQEISGAMATNDWPTIERVAHSSAGANAMVGMKKMAQLLRRLEQSAREGNPAVLAPLFSDLQKEFAEVKIYLAKNSEPQSGKAMA